MPTTDDVHEGPFTITGPLTALGGINGQEMAAVAGSSSQSLANAQMLTSQMALLESDGQLTPAEKLIVKREWEIIEAEKPQIIAQATRHSIGAGNTPYDEYLSAYNALDSYLNTDSSGVIFDLTTTTVITGTTLRTNFSTYTAKREALIDEIEGVTVTTVNAAQSTADTKIQVFLQAGEPTAVTDGDIWIDTDDGNKVSVWDATGEQWVDADRLQAGVVLSAMIADGAILNAKLAANAITTGKITDDAVTNAKVAADAVGSDQIVDGAVLTAKLNDLAVTAGKLGSDAVTNAKMATDSVDSAQLVDLSVLEAALADAAVATAKIADDAVTAAKIVIKSRDKAINVDPNMEDQSNWEANSGTISFTSDTSAPSGDNVITHSTTVAQVNDVNYYPLDTNKTYRVRFWAKQSAGADGRLYFCLRQFTAAGSACATNNGRSPYKPSGVSGIGTSWTEYSYEWSSGDWQSGVRFVQLYWLLNYAGTTGQMYIHSVRFEEVLPAVLIEDGAVIAAKIAADAVTTAKIAAGAVTATEIAAGTITANEIAASAVGADQIAANAVTTAKINALAVTAAEIAAGAITTAKIAADAITANEIAASAVGADQIAANAVTTAKINADAITAAKIAAGAVEAVAMAAENFFFTYAVGSQTRTTPQSGDVRSFLGKDPTGAQGTTDPVEIGIHEHNGDEWEERLRGGMRSGGNVADMFLSGFFEAAEAVLSAPGIIWRGVTDAFSSEQVSRVAYGNSVFVAVSDAGTVARSTDGGESWSTVTDPFGTSAIYDVKYGNSVFIACASGEKLARSTDSGATWGSLISMPTTSTCALIAIAYGDGVWVVGGGQLTGDAQMARSTDDGVNWSLITNPFGTGNRMFGIDTDGAGTWVASSEGGEIARSTNDGSSFSLVSDPFGSTLIRVIRYGGGVFIAGGDSGKLARSTDGGATWSSLIDAGFGTSLIIDLAYGEGVWVATGEDGTITRSTDGGITWGDQVYGDGSVQHPFGTGGYISGCIYAGDDFKRFVAVGDDSSGSGNPLIAVSDWLEAGSGIVEQGENSNGHYVRFSSGLQICTILGLTSSQTPSWSFPAAFYDVWAITGTITGGSTSLMFTVQVTGYSASSSNWKKWYHDGTNRGASVTEPISAIAIGRWK